MQRIIKEIFFQQCLSMQELAQSAGRPIGHSKPTYFSLQEPALSQDCQTHLKRSMKMLQSTCPIVYQLVSSLARNCNDILRRQTSSEFQINCTNRKQISLTHFNFFRKCPVIRHSQRKSRVSLKGPFRQKKIQYITEYLHYKQHLLMAVYMQGYSQHIEVIY